MKLGILYLHIFGVVLKVHFTPDFQIDWVCYNYKQFSLPCKMSYYICNQSCNIEMDKNRSSVNPYSNSEFWSVVSVWHNKCLLVLGLSKFTVIRDFLNSSMPSSGFHSFSFSSLLRPIFSLLSFNMIRRLSCQDILNVITSKVKTPSSTSTFLCGGIFWNADMIGVM